MRTDPRARLVAFVTLLALLGVAVLLLAPVDRQGLRDAVDPFGVAAPLAFVAISVLLGSAFVPGPVLAGASGLLFGTLTGFVVTLAGSVLSSAVQVVAAKQAGRKGVEALDHPRVQQVETLLRKHPVGGVVVQRLLPAVPDAPCSYLFGLAGLTAGQVALGTLIGAAPRAFSYTAIGDGLGDGGGTLAIVGIVSLVVTGALGLALAAVATRRAR